MSEQPEIQRLHANLSALLDQACEEFIEPNRIVATLVLRHESEPDVCVVVSGDTDLEEVCALIRRHGGHVDGGGVGDLSPAPGSGEGES